MSAKKAQKDSSGTQNSPSRSRVSPNICSVRVPATTKGFKAVTTRFSPPKYSTNFGALLETNVRAPRASARSEAGMYVTLPTVHVLSTRLPPSPSRNCTRNAAEARPKGQHKKSKPNAATRLAFCALLATRSNGSLRHRIFTAPAPESRTSKDLQRPPGSPHLAFVTTQTTTSRRGPTFPLRAHRSPAAARRHTRGAPFAHGESCC